MFTVQDVQNINTHFDAVDFQIDGEEFMLENALFHVMKPVGDFPPAEVEEEDFKDSPTYDTLIARKVKRKPSKGVQVTGKHAQVALHRAMHESATSSRGKLELSTEAKIIMIQNKLTNESKLRELRKKATQLAIDTARCNKYRNISECAANFSVEVF